VSLAGRRIAPLVLAALGVLSACGSDDGSQVFRVGRYCDLALQFESVALASGASSEPGRYDGPPEAFSRLLAQMGATVEELQATAPKAVRSDLDIVLGALRDAGQGDTGSTATASFAEANQHVERFRQDSCPPSPDSGDQ
jgi:hypothetical protein